MSGKLGCRIQWGAFWLLGKVDAVQHRRWEPSSTGPVSVGVVQRCCPLCGLLAVEQAHLLLLTSVPVLILATAVKEINKSYLKVDLLLLPLLHRHLRSV